VAVDYATSETGPSTGEDVRGRILEIQGLRAVAVLLVVLYHLDLPVARAGFIGVDVFFVISGFVITRLLVQSARGGRLSLGRFYARRVRRLLPALALMLSVTLVASAIVDSPIWGQRETATVAGAAAIWLANLGVLLTEGNYFAGGEPFALTHTWSLAVEEQFYLMFPVLIAVCLWWGRRSHRNPRGALLAVVGSVAVTSFILELLLTYAWPGRAGPSLAFFFPVTRAWEFAIGALVVLLDPRVLCKSRRAAECLTFVGLAGVLACAALIPGRLAFPGWVAVFPVAATALALVGVVSAHTRSASLLRSGSMQRLGDLSYSWYLWHWPFIYFAGRLFGDYWLVGLVAAAASLVMARFAYIHIEEPIRHRGRSETRRTGRLLVTCVAAPLTLALLLAAGANAGWGSRDVRDLADQLDPQKGAAHRCLSADRVADRDLAACTFGAGRRGKPVYLVGDSHAAQFADGLIRATAKAHRRLTIVTNGSCGVIDLDVRFREGSLRCREAANDVLDWLVEQEPGTVFVGSANSFVDDSDVELRDAGSWSRDVEQKGKLWSRHLASLIDRLERHGQEVVLIKTIPHLVDPDSPHTYWSPRRCVLMSVRRDTDACGTSLDLDDAHKLQTGALDAQSRAVKSTDVQVVELDERICPAATCTTNRGSFRVYLDGMHITRGMSLELAPDFTEALRLAGLGDESRGTPSTPSLPLP